MPGAIQRAKSKLGHVLSEFTTGFKTPFRGLRYLFQHPKLILYALPPAIITTTLLIIVVGTMWDLAPSLYDDHIWSQPSGEGFWVEWALGPLWKVARVGFIGVALTLSTALVAALSIPLSGPFNELLSEKVEAIETGFEAPFSVALFVRNIVTSLTHVALFFVLQSFALTLAFLIGLIPILGQIVGGVLSAIITPLIVGMIPFDYPMTLRLWRFGDKLDFINQRFPRFYGFSLASFLMLYIPFVNLAFLPSCVVGSTLTLIDLQRDGSLTTEDRRKTLLRAEGKLSDDAAPPDAAA